MRKCNLEKIYSKLALRFPQQTDGNESITLSSKNLPFPSSEITTEHLYIQKAEHIYNDWFKVDSLHFYARKETYRYLGLFILSTIFHQQASETKVRLSHPHSEIKNLILENVHQDINELTAGYHTQPLAFQYYPQLPAKHPFDGCILPKDLPCFELSNSDDLTFTCDDWKGRETVKIFGNDVGMVLFAELLLNLSLPTNEQDEFELESESGFRGVGIGSAEVRLFLPNHYAWIEENWQDL